MVPQLPVNGEELHPLVKSLVERIKQRRAEMPELSALSIDPAMGEIAGMLDGEQLFIWNELHSCRGMRKLHLEIAMLGIGLQILHCVFFPDPRFDLPIFGTDVVVGPTGVSAAIVDLSPVREELSKSLAKRLRGISIPSFKQTRELPAWGTIFSPFVRFIRPSSKEEEAGFLELVDQYLICLSSEVLQKKPESSSAASTIMRYQAQLNYCSKQKRNDKTRRILEKAFNPQWANRYIEEVLFDEPPLC